MFPEGQGGPRAFAKEGSPAPLTNGLLENGTLAIDKLWSQRGYDPKKPDVIKARLGYALDKYEACAYLVTGAMQKPRHEPRLSQPEAWMIGKRIKNIIGSSGSVGAKLVKLRKKGKATVQQCAVLLRAAANLNLHVSKAAGPPLSTPPPPTPPPLLPLPPPQPEPAPPPLPPPTKPFDHTGNRTRYPHPYWIREPWPSTAGRWSDDTIPSYRGTPGGDDEENYWKPEEPPCVPSDFRPPHLFGSKEAAEAAGAAEAMESFMLPGQVSTSTATSTGRAPTTRTRTRWRGSSTRWR